MTTSQALILLTFGALILGFAKRFPGFALKRPVALLMSLIGLTLGGAIAYWFLPVELMPNNSFGIITITTPVRGGMAPSEIERQITKPIEEAVGAASRLRNIVSESTNGKSVVSLEFEPGTNMDFATLDVREKFSRVKGNLPRDIETPIIAHYRESDVPVHIFALTSDAKSPEELRVLVDRNLKEKLMRVKGVANVDVAGGRERKIIIDVDKDRLFAHGYDIRRLVEALGAANLSVKAGELQSGALDTSIRSTGQFASVEEIANTPIGRSRDGTSIRVKDVADVRDSYLEQESLARLNSSSAVTLYVQKESDANTVQAVKGTEKVIEQFKKTLAPDIKIVEISNQGDAIMVAIGSVRESLIMGVVLIVIVLGFFLGLKPAWVVALSIPLSALITGAMLYLEKLTVNVMTLSGLALGIGLLVDNAIVVLEIIVKRLSTVVPANAETQSVRHFQKHAEKLDPRFRGDDGSTYMRQEIQHATESVTSAIVGGTLTAIVVFVPFFILSKQLQLLYSGMAITFTASLLASLYVALTTVPYLMFRLDIHSSANVPSAPLSIVTPTKAGAQVSNFFLRNKFTAWIPAFAGMTADRLMILSQNFYHTLLPKALAHKERVLGAALAVFLLSVLIFQKGIEKNFSSGDEANEFVVFVELPSGTRLDIADRVVKEVEAKIQANEATKKNIQSVTTRIDGWSGKVYVGLVAPKKRTMSAQQVIESLRPVLANIGKEQEAFVYFSSARSGQELTVNVYGEDEKTTADYAMQLAGLLEKKRGFADTKIRYRPGRPEVTVVVNPTRAALFGLNPTEIGQVLHAQTRGLRATYFRQAGEEVETIVRLQLNQRDSIDAFKALLITAPNGRQVPLEQVADFSYTLASSEIWRSNRQRMIQVSSNLVGRSLESAAQDVKDAIAQIPFNADYSAEIGGDYQDRVDAQHDFQNAVALTALLIFAVLACLFESLLQPLYLFVSVPLAACGVVLALLVTRTPVTMGVMIGILMTGGIVVNHAILFIDRFNARRAARTVALAEAGAQVSTPPLKEGKELDSRFRGNDDVYLQQVIADLQDAGQSRLRPILLTTFTTVLGLLPMALDHGNGAELWRPMAITTIGGLLSSTILTLIVLPTLIYFIETLTKRKRINVSSVTPAEVGAQAFNLPLKAGQGLDSRVRGNDDIPTRITGPFKITIFAASLALMSIPCFALAPALPPWVDKVVTRRVNDLLAEAHRYERARDYSMAIDRSLEAVRLAPTNEDARSALLRANQKGMKAAEREFEKKRKRWVREATDRDRAQSAWRDAMRGKMDEAQRFEDKGRFAEACDRYYQVLDESPSYLPALKGLEQLQIDLTKELDKGGRFPSEEARRVAQGFWFFNQRQWSQAAEIWNGVLSDAAAAKRWGSARLGEYASRAARNVETDRRDKRINDGLSEGLKQFREGRLADAEQTFKSVLEIDPANAQAKEYARLIPGLKERVRADVLTEVRDQQIANTLSEAIDFYLKGFYDEAQSKVDSVLKDSPDNPQAISIANDIRKARGVPAIPTLEERATAEQLALDKLYSDGIIAFAEGRYADAKSAWQDVLKKQPSNARAAQALKKLSEENP
jgi:HAE1 family hydrophobic/amphiphilic exporter-1